MKPTLLVLAAGMGSRYGGLKQLDPVGPSGEIIIDYSIYDAIRAGFGKVVFLIRNDIEKAFRESIGNRYKGKIEVDYAFQEIDAIPEGFVVPVERNKPWGTGHAILMAKNVINESFAVINADDFYGRSGFKLLADYFADAPPETDEFANFAMAGFVLRNTLSEHGTVSRGVCSVDSEGFLTDVVELTKISKYGDAAKNLAEDEGITDLTGDEIVSLNMWGFTPAIFTHLETQFIDFLNEKINVPKSEFFIPSVVDKVIKEKTAKLKVLESADAWFGVTYREDKPIVVANIQKLVDEGVYSEKLF
jgi:UTP-glucose-1-phosphate uridylyltransferase